MGGVLPATGPWRQDDDVVTGVVQVGRDAFQRRAWRDAYVQLSLAGRDAQLEIEDLERLATAAYLIGADDGADLWARAHYLCLRRGELVRAVRCALWLAYWLVDRGDVA
jgi:hypothetical protein